MSSRLKCVRPFLEFVTSDCISVEQRGALLKKTTKTQVKAISEIFHNLLKADLKLPEVVINLLKRKRILQKIS